MRGVCVVLFSIFFQFQSPAPGDATFFGAKLTHPATWSSIVIQVKSGNLSLQFAGWASATVCLLLDLPLPSSLFTHSLQFELVLPVCSICRRIAVALFTPPQLYLSLFFSLFLLLVLHTHTHTQTYRLLG